MRNSIIGASCLSLAAAIWGSMYVVSKYVLDFVPPVTLVWLRYIIAWAVLYILLKLEQHQHKSFPRLEKRDWLLIVWIGFIGYFVSISFQFLGTKLSDAHTGALMTSATPAFMILFARFILKELFTLPKILSLILATAGVAAIVGLNPEMGNYFTGSIILVAAAMTWALLSVYVKIAAYKFSALFITTYAIFFALLFTTPFMLWEIHSSQIIINHHLIILGILYLGVVSTAGAFYLWNKGMGMMDAGIGSLFFFLQPLVGSFLGWLFLGEHLSINFFLGGAIIILGVLIATGAEKTTDRAVKL